MEQETWKNASRGKVWVRKTDRRGELKDELIKSGGLVKISTDDRQYNQELAASDRSDCFKNGRLVPVKILDTTEDAAEIAANPNLMSETDMVDLLGAHFKTFEKKIGEITNSVTLNRILDLAEERDEKVSKINLVKTRILDVSGNAPVEISVTGDSGGGMGAVEPRPL